MGTVSDSISSGRDKNEPNESYDLYGSTGVIGRSSHNSYSGKFILVARVGANAGFLTKVNGEFGVTDNTLVVTLNQSTNIDFVFYSLKNFDLNRLIFGSGQPLITGGQLKALPLFLPSVPEQQKIADCLSSLDDLITAQSQKLEHLQAHKKGLMQQLFPAEGETVPKLRFPEFQGGLEWEEKQLRNVCQMKAGKFVAASGISEQYEDGLYPCYGGNGLRGYTETYTHSGQYSLIGRQGAFCGNINLACGKFYATEHAVVATPTSGIDTGWLFYALNVLNLNQFAIGQAQPGLSVEVLEKIPVATPRQIDEQQKIAACLSSLDELIAAQSQKIDLLKTHKKGLMQQLFPSPDGTLG